MIIRMSTVREDWIESVMVYVDILGIHCRRNREVLR
jgi:hypothetical protein